MSNFESKYSNRMEKLEIGQAVMTEKVGNIESSIGRVEKQLKDFIETADRKYAPIFAWSVIKWVGAVAGGVVVTALIYSVIVK